MAVQYVYQWDKIETERYFPTFDGIALEMSKKKWDIFHRRQNKGFVLKAVHFLLTLWFSKDNMYESPLPLHTQSLHILCGYNHTYICVLTPNDVRACV